MTAPITKDQFAFSLGKQSYIGPSYDEGAAVSQVKSGGVGRWFARQMAALAEWRRRSAVLREMETMTDRELSDIGLARSDLPRVFDASFVADHPRGRDYIAY